MSDATTPLVVGTVVVVGVGTVVTDHKVNMKAVLAGGIVALGLSAIDNVNERLASLFAALLFAGACYKFVPAIVQAAGYSGGGSGNDVDLSKAKAKAMNVSSESTSSGATAVQPAYTSTPTPTATPQLGGATTPNGVTWT